VRGREGLGGVQAGGRNSAPWCMRTMQQAHKILVLWFLCTEGRRCRDSGVWRGAGVRVVVQAVV
jgi:hypothetical protein